MLETTIITSPLGIYFKDQENMVQQLTQMEILKSTSVFEPNQKLNRASCKLTWPYLLRDMGNHEVDIPNLEEHPTIRSIIDEGLDLPNISEISKIFHAKAKKHRRHITPISAVLESESFAKAKEQVKANYGKPFSDGTSLFEYQVEAASLIVHNRRLLNANDTGTGKTLTTLVGLTSDPRNRKILIVTMSRNLFDWEREIKKLNLQDDYIQLKNPTDMKSSKRIHLVSYEAWAGETIRLIRDAEGKRYNGKYKPDTCPKCEELWELKNNQCKCGFDLVESIKKPLYRFFNRSYDAAAIDEGHYIKNGSNARSRSIQAIKTKTRVLLSGTPAENSAKDLYWPLVWLIGDRFTFGTPYESYKPSLKGEAAFRNKFGGTNVHNLLDSKSINARASNVKQLWEILDTVMYRKLKTDEDVSKEIQVPEPIHRRLHLDMTPAERTVYDRRMEEFSEWYQKEREAKQRAVYMGKKYSISSIEVCAWLDKLRKVTSCPWLQPDYDEKSGVLPSKLAFTRDKVMELCSKKKKLLIFTAHRQTAEQLGLILDEYVPGVNAAFIHGGVDMKYREQLMSRFQDKEDSLQILVMTMRTGAESYTLTEAKAVILFDLDFNAKKIEQSYSRAVRLGQKDVVEITWLINVDTIDANMHSLILSKKAGVDLAIDRVELDFEKIATEFDGDVSGTTGIDYIEFAEEMLKRGVSRNQYVGGTSA